MNSPLDAADEDEQRHMPEKTLQGKTAEELAHDLHGLGRRARKVLSVVDLAILVEAAERLNSSSTILRAALAARMEELQRLQRQMREQAK